MYGTQASANQLFTDKHTGSKKKKQKLLTELHQIWETVRCF